MVAPEFGCTIKLILEPTLKDNPLAVMWLAHVAVVSRSGFESLDGLFCCWKKMGNKTTLVSA